MLETIWEYGQEVLTAHGEGAIVRQAHVDYFCLVAEEAESALQGPQLIPRLERLEREHDNLRAALRLGMGLERALAGSADVATDVRAKVLLTAARLAFVQSNYTRSEVLAQESLALFRELGDK